MNTDPTMAIKEARQRAEAVAGSAEYTEFVELVRKKYPWRFEKLSPDVLDRDYLRIVDHHLQHLIPRLQSYVGSNVRRVLDFGCGSGGSAIALALLFPQIHCVGTDIDPDEIEMARERSKLYQVEGRCEFHCLSEGQLLPFEAGSFDFCQCSSVLEYATEREIRRFCIQEMVRMVSAGGLLFFSVPNRLYPFEIHTFNWGWNYFPKLLHARTVDCTVWEVKRLARPWVLKIHRTPVIQLLRPWSNFCLRREPS
jgi:SAM-dependent methyltransferase